MFDRRITLMMGLFVSLSGCANLASNVPVYKASVNQDQYQVKPGDSLYDIAKHFNVTERTLILWNHIQAPYRLRVGQTLRVKPLPNEKVWRVTSDGMVPVNQDGDQQVQPMKQQSHQKQNVPDVDKLKQSKHKMPAIDPSAAPDRQSSQKQDDQSDQAKKAKSDSQETHDVAKEKQPKQKKTQQSSNQAISGKTVGGITWHWPVKDQGQYQSNSDRIISFKPDAYAAANGRAVYVGASADTGGKMVILSHPNHYMTSYQGLKSVDVKEGQRVSAGALLGTLTKNSQQQNTLVFTVNHGGVQQPLSDFYHL